MPGESSAPHDARFKAVRSQVIEYLLGPGRRCGGAALTAAPVALANTFGSAGVVAA